VEDERGEDQEKIEVILAEDVNLEALKDEDNKNKETSLKAAYSGKKRGRKPAPEAKNDLWSLLQDIEESSKKDGKIVLYRGHASYRHRLRPSLFRSSNEKIRNREHSIIRELVSRHPEDFSSDSTVFEMLVRLQHYKMPTRLLDLTFNPLVAIYFACSENEKYNPEIVEITIDSSKIKYYDSDTVACVANLCNLSKVQQDEIKGYIDNDQLNLTEGNAGERLFDFIIQKRPNFRPKIVLDNLKDFFVVLPKMNNPRIIAQNGAFMIFGLTEELTSRSGIDIKRYRINKDKNQDILDSLGMLGVNESTIYPSIDTSVEELKRRYK